MYTRCIQNAKCIDNFHGVYNNTNIVTARSTRNISNGVLRIVLTTASTNSRTLLPLQKVDLHRTQLRAHTLNVYGRAQQLGVTATLC